MPYSSSFGNSKLGAFKPFAAEAVVIFIFVNKKRFNIRQLEFMPKDLDTKILSALSKLNKISGSTSFDIEGYIKAFQKSAQDKAKSVLGLLEDESSPFFAKVPIFVSIGGGDGEELAWYLDHSDARCGVLVEMSKPLADAARSRKSSLNKGKTIEVFEGDAKERISDAIEFANNVVKDGNADFVAITCHAVIHELFDRGKDKFDPLSFFATLFQDEDISTWFTYREPGVPEKWPDEVMLTASCETKNLLSLADAICFRHHLLAELEPKPQIVGDRLRVHRNLAMELLMKLFYITDLPHEIEERTTSVYHAQLINYLWLAIGDKAKQERRANVVPQSSPTKSFTKHWEECGISVIGLQEGHATFNLSIPESQTRVIAWRLSKSDQKKISQPTKDYRTIESGSDREEKELEFAQKCLEEKDFNLLSSVLLSRARAWIESSVAESALTFLRKVMSETPSNSLSYLWSHYIYSIAGLFSGDFDAESFSIEYEDMANHVGLGPLFRAERMEFFRKSGHYQEPIDIANSLMSFLKTKTEKIENEQMRYVHGTTIFLLGNLFRFGGRYDLAWEALNKAEGIFSDSVPSHQTELAHCTYAKAVCAAMTGVASLDIQASSKIWVNQIFAGALITLTQSHAAWFLDDLNRAENYAREAEKLFRQIGAAGYANRASQIANLINLWSMLHKRKSPTYDAFETNLARGLATLIGDTRDLERLSIWFRKLRPSKALGLLQFAKEFSNSWDSNCNIFMPSTLTFNKTGDLEWSEPTVANSLRSADKILRERLNIQLGRRIPLIAD